MVEIGKDNSMIDIIWNVTEQFIEDWRNSPYEWQTEIDIQAEIASQLRQSLKNKDKLIMTVGGYEYIRRGKMQDYSRVCCEWSTNYDLNGEKKCCQPDIIVYEDTEDSNNLPDKDPKKNWPMLWVCEIKYQTEDKDVSKQSKSWDTDKMVYLLKQNESRYGCILYFNRKEINTMPIISIEEQNGRLRRYTILPKK